MQCPFYNDCASDSQKATDLQVRGSYSLRVGGTKGKLCLVSGQEQDRMRRS